MDTFWGIVVLWVCLMGAYVYGVKVGGKAGVARGRAAADAEWALRLEHGAV